jgi:hypothetical protein
MSDPWIGITFSFRNTHCGSVMTPDVTVRHYTRVASAVCFSLLSVKPGFGGTRVRYFRAAGGSLPASMAKCSVIACLTGPGIGGATLRWIYMGELLMDNPDRFRGCLLGLAVGDAVGAALEFKRQGVLCLFRI